MPTNYLTYETFVILISYISSGKSIGCPKHVTNFKYLFSIPLIYLIWYLVCFKIFKEKVHAHVHTKENAKHAKLIRGV
jgi:hypothetical protein